MHFTDQNTAHNPNEYRIPERDCTPGPIPTLPNGTKVSFTRRVDRVGYEIDKFSFSKSEWEAKGLEIIAGKTGLDPAIITRVITAMNLHSPYKGLKSQIYHALMNTCQAKPENKNIRAMWFVDFGEPVYLSRHAASRMSCWRGIIIGRMRRWTGKYSPAWDSSSDYWNNYEPARLSGFNQNLYKIRDYESGLCFLVYPDDIMKVEE